jgi:hypothetical protein
MNNRIALISTICFCLVVAACVAQADSIGEQEARDMAWQALEPNTSSHKETAWEALDARLVSGRDIQDQFEGEPVPGDCAPGPTPPENATVTDDVTYWYVQLKPRPATAIPEPTEQFSPTAPPHIPEPFIVEAKFLIDAATGKVVARKISCVIY